MLESEDEATLLTRIRIEQERRRRELVLESDGRYEWYGEHCHCSRYDEATETCPVHARRARWKQRPPEGEWIYWAVKAGRGFGKTRTGAEWVRWLVESWHAKGVDDLRIALIGPTASDVRDTMVLGESGVMSCAPPWFRPVFQPTYRRLVWPGGSQAFLYSADEPERLRGPQHHYAWCDEMGAWRYPETWRLLLPGMRLGREHGIEPQYCITTTPKPVEWLRKIWKMPGMRLVVGSSRENLTNLSQSYKANVIDPVAGTRYGRQEIEAEEVEDTDGALWTSGLLDETRRSDRDIVGLERVRIAVAVDPMVANPDEDPDSDDPDSLGECGITAGFLGDDDHGYVTHDASLRAKPNDWAMVACQLYHDLQADVLAVEKNNGGMLVETTMKAVNEAQGWPPINFNVVWASRGKTIRAEPISAMYEQGKIHHVGYFDKLERQLTGWVPGNKSPDRLDSLVWLMTELMMNGAPLVIGDNPFTGYRG